MTWEAHPLEAYLFPFHIVCGVFEARVVKWFAIPFSSGPCFVRALHHDPSFLGGPAWYIWLIVSLSYTRPIVLRRLGVLLHVTVYVPNSIL